MRPLSLERQAARTASSPGTVSRWQWASNMMMTESPKLKITCLPIKAKRRMKEMGERFMSEKMYGSMKDLKVGKYVLIDDEPCRVVGVESSAPGKHGAAKMRVSAMSIFSGNRKTLMKPSDA